MNKQIIGEKVLYIFIYVSLRHHISDIAIYNNNEKEEEQKIHQSEKNEEVEGKSKR